MTQPTSRARRSTSRQRVAAWALSAIVLVVFVAANAHLVAVSVATQPGCVAHDGGAPLRAAKPSC